MGDFGKVPISASLYFGTMSDELSKTEVTRDNISELVGKLKDNKSLGPKGILLTKICNLSPSSVFLLEDWKVTNGMPF